MKLNVFVDETGDFGFSKNSSLVYGVSFVFHEKRKSIKSSIKALNERLNRIGYLDMIHTANLITNRGEYKNTSLDKRKLIFNAIYYFSLDIDVNINLYL